MESNAAKFLWKYAQRMKLLCFYILISIVIASFMARLLNYYSAEIVDLISKNPVNSATLKKVFGFIGLIFVAVSLQSVFEAVQKSIENKFIPYNLSKISRDLFLHAHKHSSSFFAEEMSGNIAGKIKNIVDNVERAYFHLRQGLFRPLVSFFTSIGFIAYVDLRLALGFLVFSALFMTAVINIKRRIIPMSAIKAKLNSEATGILVDSITNSDLVKNFSNFNYEKKLYYSSVNRFMKALKREVNKYVLVDFSTRFFNSLMTIGFYSLTFYFWYVAELSVGEVVLCISLVSSLESKIENLGYFSSEFVQVIGNISDGLKLLSTPCEIVDQPNAPALKVTSGGINFSNINYRYKLSSPLFEDFSLDIKPGERIGLVGRSGSGKSTLVRLLSRYYDLESGEINIYGQDIAQVSQDSLRSHIAMIPQDPSLFHRTIMENIRYGNLRASDEEVIAAAKKAYCHDFIMNMPKGYDSKVGERGIMLSGGERQRIAIARAILKDAPILVLDEATSALDSESERYIQESLRELMKGKTVIAIAHRLSTLKEMDQIVVMDRGRIIEQGTHLSLLRKKGTYHSFYDLQSSGFLSLSN